MRKVENRIVSAADAGLRLDRWFARHFPTVPFGHLQKLLRTGQVRVDGKRAKSGLRLAAKQTIRIPPLEARAKETSSKPRDALSRLSKSEEKKLLDSVIHKDDEVLALNKPAGLAVQGGSGTPWHLELLLPLFQFDAPEPPRLVHRLDRDTSGVLLLGRSASAAAWITKAFRKRETEKVYWAVVLGRLMEDKGTIDLPLMKRESEGGEKVFADSRGKPALTRWVLLDNAGSEVSLLAMMPVTGRTHQLRAHARSLGTPILGDGKYGGKSAFHGNPEIERRVHLHARAIRFENPAGEMLTIIAPPPPHMRKTCEVFGLSLPERGDPFARFRQPRR